MKIVDITTCIKITEENDMYGIERYLDIGSKIKITFNSGNTLTGYVQYLDYGHYPGENVLLVLKQMKIHYSAQWYVSYRI